MCFRWDWNGQGRHAGRLGGSGHHTQSVTRHGGELGARESSDYPGRRQIVRTKFERGLGERTDAVPEDQNGVVETPGSLDREAGTGAPGHRGTGALVGGIVVSSAAKSQGKRGKKTKRFRPRGTTGIALLQQRVTFSFQPCLAGTTQPVRCRRYGLHSGITHRSGLRRG